MSHTAKLSLAVGLAIFAAILNAMWLSAEKTPPLFAATTVNLKAGEVITEAALAPVPVPGDVESLRSSLIPYANRAILLGQTTSRELVAGDVFFQRDIQTPTKAAKFEVLGPFKLISVGERFKQAGASEDDTRLDPGGNNVTIAVGANFDERTRRLLQIIDPNQKTARDAVTTKIVAVQVVPADQQSPEITDDKNVVFQTVSLQDIENVPRVLLEGEVIRFVIPAPDTL
jgi:hypothetical protein